MKKPLSPSPVFDGERGERAFWEANDSTAHIDWSKAKRVAFPSLKPSTRSISLRLPEGLLDDIRIAANRRDVPYQSLIKIWLSEKVRAG
jgi:predicted DNA binding CopG/RHH family protein